MMELHVRKIVFTKEGRFQKMEMFLNQAVWKKVFRAVSR